MTIKNARASRARLRALDCSASLRRQNLRKNFWGPPLTKSWIIYLLFIPNAGRLCLHRCLSVHREGTPASGPRPFTSRWFQVLLQGLKGYPYTGQGNPLARTGVSPGQDWGTPRDRRVSASWAVRLLWFPAGGLSCLNEQI